MPAIIQYLLKLSVSAAVIYAFYYLVLRRLTFYSLNRWYLAGYTLLCFIIPFINITQIANRADEKMPALNYIPAVQNIKNYMPSGLNETEHHNYNIWDAMLILLAIGSVILLVKLAVQMISFMHMKRRAKLISDKDSAIYHVDEQIMPFSFGKSIYLNKNMHSDKELGEIIMHEYVHVKQLHSADILIAELFCVVNWFNPFAWFIRHSIRQNLEFIADDNVVRSGINKKDYQYHLLKVVGIPQYRIANQFNFSSLKKRIIMMNRARSAKIHLLKFMFILPLLAVTLMAFRNDIINTVNKITTKPKPVMAIKNSMLPAISPNGTLTGWLKKGPVLHSAKKEIIRPDTTSKESVELTAYFKGVVLKTQEIAGTYLIIIRDGDRFDTYSNLTSVKVKKGDKVKKGQLIGTADVDLATGIPKLKYQMYNGDVMVYDADGSDTVKRGYNAASGYGSSYSTKAYVVSPAKASTWSTGSSGSGQVYVVSPAPSYNVSGTVAYDSTTYAASPVAYTAAGYSTPGSGNVSEAAPGAVVVYQGKTRVDPVRIGSGRTYVMGNVSYVMAGNDPDELTFTIDPKHIEPWQFAPMEKKFADNGFKLKIKGDLKNNSDSKLRIEISGSKDNSTSSATATFSSDDLHNSNSFIKITGDKKTGLVSIVTYR
jgi:beta-lactamase regulating signal transducer with metallopeptidase domain